MKFQRKIGNGQETLLPYLIVLMLVHMACARNLTIGITMAVEAVEIQRCPDFHVLEHGVFACYFSPLHHHNFVSFCMKLVVLCIACAVWFPYCIVLGINGFSEDFADDN